MELKGRTVLVTGAAKRIGRAIAEAFAGKGSDLVVHYRTSRGEAEELCEALRARGVRAWALCAELSDPEACEKLVADALERAGRLDVLVNSAAVFEPDSIRSFDPAAALAQWRVNLIAPICLTRAFAERCGRGKVIHLLDRRIRSHDTEHLSYVIGKKALEAFTALAALELAPEITVNAVAPGAILPPPGRDGIPGGCVPLERQCGVEEVACSVLHAAENDAMTGQVLFVDGGQHLLGNAADEGGGLKRT